MLRYTKSAAKGKKKILIETDKSFRAHNALNGF